ncbi:MAG: hypothetical protein WAN14_16805 [Candidatus Acidiferrales bacterium]
MRKQIISVAAALLVSIVLAGRCGAQQVGAIDVNIPFAFQAGDRTMPAGEYRIQRLSAEMEGIQLIQQHDGKNSTTVTSLPAESKDKSAPARLVFNRYGNEYFLAEIWADGTHGRRLHKSGREKEWASTLGRTEVAVLAHAYRLSAGL